MPLLKNIFTSNNQSQAYLLFKGVKVFFNMLSSVKIIFFIRSIKIDTSAQ